MMSSSEKNSSGDSTPESPPEQPRDVPKQDDLGGMVDDEGFVVLPPGFKRTRDPDEERWVFESWT
jgi:hypothetical protein